MESTAGTKKRKYTRRTAEERIADLERRIVELKARQAAKEKKESPVLKEIPKIARRLRKFAQLAMDHQRPDIANSTTAFTAMLDRVLQSEIDPTPSTPPIEELEESDA